MPNFNPIGTYPNSIIVTPVRGPSRTPHRGRCSSGGGCCGGSGGTIASTTPCERTPIASMQCTPISTPQSSSHRFDSSPWSSSADTQYFVGDGNPTPNWIERDMRSHILQLCKVDFSNDYNEDKVN